MHLTAARIGLLVLACAVQVVPLSAQGAATHPAWLPDLEWLCSDSRRGRGDEKARREVASWVCERFTKAGLKPLFGDSYLQPFRFLRFAGMNVGGILPGRGWPQDRRHVIVSAHFDHLGTRRGRMHPGASDNAAGVASLLAIMRRKVASKERPPVSLVFLAFDLEEYGLLGSRHYAANAGLPLDDLLVFTTMDIMGRELLDLPDHRIAVLGTERSPELGGITAAARRPALDVFYVGVDAIGDRSDYGPFRSRGIPFLFFTSGENRDYHRPTDTVARLDLGTLGLQQRYVEDVLHRLLRLEKRPVFLEKPRTHRREVESLASAASHLLKRHPGPLREAARRVAAEVEALRKTGGVDAVKRQDVRLMTRRLMLALRSSWKRR